MPTGIMTHIAHFPHFGDPWTPGWSLRSHLGLIPAVKQKKSRSLIVKSTLSQYHPLPRPQLSSLRNNCATSVSLASNT